MITVEDWAVKQELDSSCSRNSSNVMMCLSISGLTFLCWCDAFVLDASLQLRMASNIAGMALIPYYNHIMNIIETDKNLKKTFSGL